MDSNAWSDLDYPATDDGARFEQYELAVAEVAAPASYDDMENLYLTPT